MKLIQKKPDSDSDEMKYNLTKDLVLTDINQYWADDITYICLKREFVYLAVVIDVFSRKCIR